MRWKLTIEYDGSPFHGWQKQKNAISVQEILEQAIFRLSAESVPIFGAGRTDNGVHALAQTAHLDVKKTFTAQQMQHGMNAHMADYPIRIIDAQAVDENFHARFDATQRQYIYRILQRASAPALERNRIWHIQRPLDFTAMQQACQFFVGKHDFTSFRASECQAKSPIKTIDLCEMRQPRDRLYEGEWQLHIHARSFLHHQVRNIMGTLKQVGSGKYEAESVTMILAARERSQAGMTAPASGLYLAKVCYD